MLVLSDQQRWDFDGNHFTMRMPNLKRLAAEGVTFSQAFCPSPLCAPSRNALAAGREHTEMRQHYPKNAPLNPNFPIGRVPTFYMALRNAGYHTMSAGKDDLTKEKQDRENMMKNGAASMKALGFADFERTQGKRNTIGTPPQPRDIYGVYLKSQKGITVRGKQVDGFEALQSSYNNPVGPKSHAYQSFLPDGLYEDNFVGDVTVRLLRRKPARKPWFLQVNFPGPHDPFAITAGMEASVAGRTFGVATGSGEWLPGQRRDTEIGRRYYGAEVENLDRILGVLLHEIRDEESQTIVCYSSDHGEMLGDDGKWGKQTAAQGSVAVPLVCRGPGFRAGHTVHGPVSTLDLTGTFIDYGRATRPKEMTARSLRPLLEGTSTHAATVRSTVHSALKNWVLYVTSISISKVNLAEMDFSDRTAIEREARDGRISVRILGLNCKRPVLLKADNSILKVRSISPGLSKAVCQGLDVPSRPMPANLKHNAGGVKVG